MNILIEILKELICMVVCDSGKLLYSVFKEKVKVETALWLM